MPSTSTSMSAQRCLTAWKLPIGAPNWTRSLAYCGGQLEHPPAAAQQLGRGGQRPEGAQPGRSAGAPEADGRGVASRVEPRQRPGEVHGRLAPAGARRPPGRPGRRRRAPPPPPRRPPRPPRPGPAARSASSAARRRRRSRRRAAPDQATAADGRPADQAAGHWLRGRSRPARRPGPGAAGRAGPGRRVPPDLLEEHGGLDPAEPEPALVLGHGHRRPALVGHGGPQRRAS